MKCAWNDLLSVLPVRFRCEVDKFGKDTLQELRLRQGIRVELVMSGGSRWLDTVVTQQDISYIVNMASRYSPWSAATVSEGYITARGGHRIGLCGESVIADGEMKGIRTMTSLCVRVARDFPGIAAGILDLPGNILILGPPGCGKTTLLRDLIRQRSEAGPGSVTVVDERGELFPLNLHGDGFSKGCRTDIISGCPKSLGIQLALRTMGPSWIAVDEITAEADCRAMMRAGWCGVRIMATAHAGSVDDLINRPIYRPLATSGLFETSIVLGRDKSWRMEMIPCCH